ncbi:MAG TPA: DUF4845 domain-containing protein [Rhodocyclaceae bacterium]|nr:DUF4845 domain-containing protein [Rhodocyclaceae bacterium]
MTAPMTRFRSTKQQGFTLTGLILVMTVLAMIALLAAKVLPEVSEYRDIVGINKAIVADPIMRSASLSEVKTSFSKRADVAYVKSITADDLDITKDGDQLVISFAYPKKIPLFANVSLLIDFEGSTAK